MRIDQKILLIMKYLSNAENEIEGKTLLQKSIYFVNEILKLDIKFEPYYYGPYSSEVTFSIEEMKGAGIIEEEVEKYPFEPWLNQFEPKLFKYKFTDFGDKFFEFLEKDYKGETEKIREVVEKIKSASGSSQKILSIAGKMYYILALENKPIYLDKIIEEAKCLDWNIEKDEAEKAVNFLKEIGLIEKN